MVDFQAQILADDTRSFVPFSRSRFSFFIPPYHGRIPKAFLFFFFPPFRSWIAVRSLASTQRGESSSYRKRVKATRRHQLSNISTTSCAAADNSLSARWSAKSAREGGYDTRFRRHLNPCELPIPRDGRGSLARGIARFQPPRVSRLVRRHASVKTGGLLLLLLHWNWNWNEWVSECVCVCTRAHTSKASREIELRYSGAAIERIGIARCLEAALLIAPINSKRISGALVEMKRGIERRARWAESTTTVYSPLFVLVVFNSGSVKTKGLCQSLWRV